MEQQISLEQLEANLNPEGQEFLALMRKRWPSDLAARNVVDDVTGGALHPRTLANRDSLKSGALISYQVGGKIVYPLAALAEMMSRK